MNTTKSLLLSFLLIHLSILPLFSTEITNLKVEYTETPLGIDIDCPRFSWQMKSDTNGTYQTAYRIIVTDESGQTVWDTDKIKEDISLNIKYDGTVIQPCTRYHWKVTVWDEKEKEHTAQSWFESGLMNPYPPHASWGDAYWIGGGDEDMVLQLI